MIQFLNENKIFLTPLLYCIVPEKANKEGILSQQLEN